LYPDDSYDDSDVFVPTMAALEGVDSPDALYEHPDVDMDWEAAGDDALSLDGGHHNDPPSAARQKQEDVWA
jgi:hypothetical protein